MDGDKSWRALFAEDVREDMADDLLDPESGYGDMIDILSNDGEAISEDAQRMVGSEDDDADINQEDENIDALELESFKDDFLDTGRALATVW